MGKRQMSDDGKAEVKSIAAERALLVLFIIFYTLFTIMPVHSVFFRMYYNSLCVYRNVIHNIFFLDHFFSPLKLYVYCYY